MNSFTLTFGLLILVSLLGVNWGSTTITLTGVCHTSTVNVSNSNFTFSIHNSGNGIADNLVLVPYFKGFSISNYNNSAGISALMPNATYSYTFKVNNFSAPGSYIELIIVNYQQGGSSFSTVYPCITNVEKPSHSLLVIANETYINGILNVTVLNLASHAIGNGSISIFAPPLFSVQPTNQNVTLPAFSSAHFQFKVKSPSYSNASLPLPIGLSYMENGVHYAYLSSYLLTISNAKKSLMPIAEIASIALIIILVALIIVSIFYNRRKKHARSQQQSQQQNHV
ncbi:MAG: hypothetical protein ACP5RM_00875 [Candidatus Micrarchaeia archaeon]